MTIVLDIVLGLIIIGFAVRGFRSGLLRSVGSTAGLLAGGVAAVVLAPLAAPLLPAGQTRTIVLIVGALVLLALGYGVGTAIGGAIGGAVRRTPVGTVDRALGAGMQLAVAALAVSVLASIAAPGAGVLGRPLAESFVLSTIHAATPAPVTQALDTVRSTITGGVLTSGLLPLALDR